MSTGIPWKYVQKSAPVEAVQFLGWENAQAVWTWSGGKLFYVPRGHEHSLRKKNEYDSSNNHVLEDAVPYMVLLGVGHENSLRVEIRSWVIKNVDGDILVCKNEDFVRLYEELK